MGHATACATTTSTRTIPTSTTNWQSPGTIPKFIEETQPDRVHVLTEDGTVYEVTRPSVEDNAINGDYIVRVGNNPDLRGAPIPLDEIVSLQPVVLSEDTSLSEKPSFQRLIIIGVSILALVGIVTTDWGEAVGDAMCKSKGHC